MDSKKLFISDLDGTLLNNVPSLSKFSLNNLNRLLENEDFHFTIATARSYISAKELLNGLNIKLPVILFNGAFITNFENGSHYHIFDIAKECLNPVMDVIKDANCSTLISAHNNGEDLVFYDQTPNEGIQWYIKDREKANDKRLRKSNDLQSIFSNQILSINVIDTFKAIEPLSNYLQKEYGNQLHIHHYENPYQPGYYWLTMNTIKANKGNTVKLFCEQYGYQLENTTTFGDNLNDLEMLEMAGTGICTQNAVSKAKQKADLVIDLNENDAVVKYILDQTNS